ncbi:MAG: hypothetical protein GX783_11485 [Clostridiales bacterium]|nr:hypothetical protein [Clostridiales bacterium]
MLKSLLKTILAIEALAFLLISIFGKFFENAFTSLFAFPFEQLSMGLRFLSTSSAIGNVIAIILYSVICILPTVYYIFRAFKNSANTEDKLLILISVLLFPIIYLMINPAYIGRHFGAFELIEMNKSLLGVTIYSTIIGYLILRGLRIFNNSEAKSILKYMKVLMFIICIVLIYAIFGSGFSSLLSSMRQLMVDNTDLGQNLFLSKLFLILQNIVSILPFILQIIIIFSGFELIDALNKDPYSDDVVISARKTVNVCRNTIVAIMMSQITINILQFVLGSKVRSSHYTLSVPLMSVVLVLAVMLLASYFEQVKSLKEDNDLFV